MNLKNFRLKKMFIFILFIPYVLGQRCFSLKGSTVCPAFANYYISLTPYPFLSNITSISSFDSALKRYMVSNEFKQTLGCSLSEEESIRYGQSYLCTILIQEVVSSLPCNYQQNLTPPPLCQVTCFDFANSFGENCQLKTSCQNWSGLNGGIDCISGRMNEPSQCGFLEIESACEYCSSHEDICCDVVNCKKGLSVGAIVGIVIGFMVVVLIGGLLIWFKYKKRNGEYHKGNVVYQKERGGNDSLLGYDYVTSQNALLSYGQVEEGGDGVNTTIVGTSTGYPDSFIETPLEEFYQVKHPYPPQMGDELGLEVGDIVCMAMNFDDGWALGFNVTTGRKGVFPLVCVTPAPEELLTQLLQMEQPTSRLLNDETQLQHICDTIRRSISLTRPVMIEPVNSIPRRTASIMKKNHNRDLMQHLSQPEPVFFQPTDFIEMKKQNNRVSKLEE